MHSRQDAVDAVLKIFVNFRFNRLVGWLSLSQVISNRLWNFIPGTPLVQDAGRIFERGIVREGMLTLDGSINLRILLEIFCLHTLILTVN